MRAYAVVGKSLPRLDGPAKVTGEALFTTDEALPGMLYGKILRSPYPHARIAHIDITKAQRLPGVKGIITGKDTLGRRYGYLPATTDQCLLVEDKVRYIGDEVAAVAAISEDIACEALELIDVDYEELPAAFDPHQAMDPSSPRLHGESNIAYRILQNFGDVEKGLKTADYVREDTFSSQWVSTCFLETPACLAGKDSGGRLTLWSSTQNPFKLRKDISLAVGIPESRIRVIKPHVGGGFCGKGGMLPVDFCAALLALKTERPVKMVYTREETFLTNRGRVPMTIHLKTGVKGDGTLVATDARVIADNGGYTCSSPVSLLLAGSLANLPYRLPHLRFEGLLVYTNNPPSSVGRGGGNVQLRFASETQLDMIAEALGLDPVAIRLKNSLQPGDVTANEYRIASCGLSECIRGVVPPGWKEGGGGRLSDWGNGLACGGHVAGGSKTRAHDSASAFIKLDENGTATLLTGASDVGQGSDTVLAQIAAEEIGLALENIRVVAADTDLTPMDLGTYGSRVTMIAGNAVKMAAIDARQQLLAAAAEMLEARPQDLEVREGRIFVKGSVAKGTTFSQAVTASVNKGKPILGRGSYNPPTEPRDMQSFKGNVSPAYGFAAQSVRVQVDRDSGQVRLLGIAAAQDVGFALNPMAVEGQIQGSVSGGLGQAFGEELIREGGLTLNPSFVSYPVPTALDVSPIDCTLVETIDPEGPFGAKGVGELGQVPTVPAVINAIHDATGMWIKELPATPERLLSAADQV